MSSAQPQVIGGRYELTAPVSTGGMGQVWRGYDTVLDRDIAVKLIRPDLTRDDDTRAELISRFRREARVTAKIEHSSVPAVYDAAFDVHADRLYLVMQLVHGVSVADVLAERGAASVEWAVSVAAQVCAALSYAHALPVVHRDLKPANIMIADDGGVKVLDFGVAAVLRSDVTQLTATGNVIGTKPYMSPEQIHNTTVSPRSDLYALGCLLHEMLSGSKVFDAADEVALMYQHLEQAPTPLRRLRAEVPEQIERLVLDLLAKQPDDRPESAWEVHDRLAPFLPQPDPATPRPAGTRADPSRPYRYPMALRSRKDRPAETPETQPQASPLAHDELDAAYEHAVELIDAERGSQAAEVLGEIIPYVSDQTQALELREVRAAALFLAGDYRQALPEFDSLAVAHARAYGPDAEQTLACRRQAAYCRLELGDLAEALAEMRAVLVGYRSRGQERDPDILMLRRTIAGLQIATGQQQQARDALPALHAEVCEALGGDDPLVAELRDMMTRLDVPST